MTQKPLLQRPGFWLGVAGAAALSAGVAYYLYNKDEIDYYIRLYGVKRRADKFYNQHPHIHKDIQFCETQKLDVYRPDEGTGYPVLVYVYGGSWTSGNKELYAPAAQLLMPHGVMIAVLNYTLYPAANYRQQMNEVSAGIAWTWDNIAHYGGDPSRVVVCGQSAGGHLAALSLFDEQWLGRLGHHVSEIKGFLGISGVYDLVAQMEWERANGRDGQLMIEHFEGQENFALASPIAYVRPDLPPVRLIHGDADRTVPIAISDTLYAALEAAGNQCDYLVYQGGKHAEILFEALVQEPPRLIRDMTEFVSFCTGIKQPPSL
jgi:acetyl esterase/lipase